MLHLTGDVNTKAPYWPGKRTIELTVCLFFIMLVDMYDHKITCNIYMNHRKAGGRFEHGLSQLIIEVCSSDAKYIFGKVSEGMQRDL